MTQAEAAEQYLLREITTALFFTAAEGGRGRAGTTLTPPALSNSYGTESFVKCMMDITGMN